ncbi:sulfite exporter TauE/SafE family protein [Bradyrhizobium sp.]|uniref:sulfite exporter TauE/SafE family protein n=1 Tax=Bradyrhizobium sp. TaxID=376 RepID=UPI003C41D5D4
MFDFDQPLLVAGLLLGLASSLHCLSMCSGIAASLCLASTPLAGKSLRSLYWTNLLINAGRITGYVLAGAAVGGLGVSVFGALDRSIAHIVLRWAAAVSLGWIGLSMTGFVPLPTPLLHVGAAVSRGLGRVAGAFPSYSLVGPFVAGCVWGFFPCAMVYAALFYAMLSGSWLNGALVMFGFGLGTLLPVMGAGLGVSWLRSRAQSPRLQMAVGLAIVTLGIASTLPGAAIAQWCRGG